MDLADLLLVYGNWRSRLVPALPRTVHVSRELTGSAKWKEHEGPLDEIIGAIEAGDDLTPYLSTGIRVPHATSKRDKKTRRDRDLLISDWSIHHLHLSTRRADEEFVTRTGDLLFVRFEPRDAYLIAVYPHGSWALQEMVRILVRNWPEANLYPRMAGVSLVTSKTDEDHARGRSAGLMQPVEVDGDVYIPLGQTSAGTPMDVTQRVNVLIHSIREWEEHPIDELRRHLRAGRLPRDQVAKAMTDRWSPRIGQIEGHEGVVLTNGKIFIPVGPLP